VGFSSTLYTGGGHSRTLLLLEDNFSSSFAPYSHATLCYSVPRLYVISYQKIISLS